MLSPQMEKALNNHLALENYSAHLYLSMTAYFRSIDLPGFSNWMHMQYQEELAHAMKFFNYIDDRDGRVLLQSIEAPKIEWESPLEVYQNTYDHERLISKEINNLATLSIKENDHFTNNFLQWFIAEQVEEEANAKGILQKIKFAQNSPTSILMIESEVAARKFVAPV